MNLPPSEASAPMVTHAAPPLAAPGSPIALRSELARRMRAIPGAVSGRGMTVLTDQVVVSGTSLLTTVMIGRLCGAEQLGLYVLAMTAVVLATVVHESLVCSPFMVLGAVFDCRRRSEFATSMLWLHVAISLGGMLVAAGVALLIGYALEAFAWQVVGWVLVLVVPCVLVRELSRRFALARRSPRTALGIDAMQMVLQLGLLTVLAVSGHLSAVSGLLALAAGSAITGSLGMLAQRTQFAPRAPQAGRDCLKSVRFGSWIVAARAVSIFSAYSMHWLLAVWLSKAATGVFAACNTITMFTNPLVLGWSAHLGPQAAAAYAEQRHVGLRRTVNHSILFLGSVMLILSGTAAIGGEFFLRLLYGGGHYSGAGLVIAVLALNVLVGAVSVCFSHGLTTLRRSDLNLRVNIISLTLTLASAWPLIVFLQLPGAALALLFGNIVGSVIQGWMFYRLVRRGTA